MDFYKDLMTGFESRTKGFKEREAQILAKLETLAESEKSGVFQARLNSFERKSEDALAVQDMKTVEKCLKEIVLVREQLQAEAAQVTILSSELEELRKKIALAGEQTLKEIYPLIRQTTHQEWEKAADLTSEAWVSLQRFGRETRTPLSLSLHHDQLSPVSWSASKILEKKLGDWV